MYNICLYTYNIYTYMHICIYYIYVHTICHTILYTRVLILALLVIMKQYKLYKYPATNVVRVNLHFL